MIWKVLNKILLGIILIINIGYIYNQLSSQVYDRLLIGLAIIPILLAPLLIKKLLHYNLEDHLLFGYYVFVFLAYTMGSILNIYKFFPGFDKIVHFISGILTAIILYYILQKCHNLSQVTPLWFQIFSIITFSLAVASVWELFEFLCDMIVGGDCQHVQDTGVNDTMLDMLVAFLGSIVFSIYYYLKLYKRQNVNK